MSFVYAGSTQILPLNSETTVSAPGTLDLRDASHTLGNLSGNGTVDNSSAAPTR